MGLQLSILVGCAGALELCACLRHMFVCVLKLTDQPSTCCVSYFHRSRIAEDLVAGDKSSYEDDSQKTCSEIEAILRENRSEPDILCLGPPPPADGYVRIPTPVPFGMTDDVCQRSSSNPSSVVDSGNENPTIQNTTGNMSADANQYNGSSSDLDSIEKTTKSTTKKLLRRSKTPEVHRGSYDDYDDGEEEDADVQKKHHKSSKSPSGLAGRRSARSKSELRKSAENLSSVKRSKRHREPERCKSDIQMQVSRNPLRDEWTNTSPMNSEGNLSKGPSKRSVSVLIQTSFEDKLQFPENNSLQTLDAGSKLKVCPNCCCRDVCKESRVRRVTETESVDGRPQLVKISSFEEASGDDYDKIKNVIAGGSSSKKASSKNWSERIKSSIDSESYDEYVDAEDDSLTLRDQPIQYSIPDPGDNQAFWVT